MVPARRLLRGAASRVLRLQQRRHRRHPGPPREARLPAVAGCRRDLAAALLPLAHARRRLRHQRLLQRRPRLRDPRGPGPAPRRRAPPGHPLRRRPGHEPHQRRPPVVRRVALEPGQPEERLVRLERRRPALARGPRRVHRRRTVQLDLGRHPPAVLLAPLLLPPARSQLREPRGRRHHGGHGEVLAGTRLRRLPPGRGAIPLPARRHGRRAPPRDPRVHQADPQGDRGRLPRSGAVGRGQRLAGRRGRLLR